MDWKDLKAGDALLSRGHDADLLLLDEPRFTRYESGDYSHGYVGLRALVLRGSLAGRVEHFTCSSESRLGSLFETLRAF